MEKSRQLAENRKLTKLKKELAGVEGQMDNYLKELGF